MKKSILFFSIAFTSLIHAQVSDQFWRDVQKEVKSKNPEQAIEVINKALSDDPEDSALHQYLGTVFYLMQKYDKAAYHYEKSLSIKPNQINTVYNLGLSLCKQGLFTKAIPLFEQARQQLPNEPSLHGILLKLYLRNKNWKKAAALNPSSLWWFDTNIVDKKIYLDLDKPGNGYGDAIQFVRYASILHRAGAEVTVRVAQPLVPLFSLCPYIKQVLTSGDPQPEYDMQFSICIASLMQTLRHRIFAPTVEPYLAASPQLIDEWQNKLKQDTNFKIGLCWESNLVKDLYTGKVMPSPRSISLESLIPLAKKGVSFYSLQKLDKKIETPFQLHQFDGDFDASHGRFMDTAAVIINCDLVITVDTSIAHLAGALGKPVWVLLSSESDYRWFSDQRKSFWYPNMTLYRQARFDSWQNVIEEINQNLELIIKNKKIL